MINDGNIKENKIEVETLSLYKDCRMPFTKYFTKNSTYISKFLPKYKVHNEYLYVLTTFKQ